MTKQDFVITWHFTSSCWSPEARQVARREYRAASVVDIRLSGQEKTEEALPDLAEASLNLYAMHWTNGFDKHCEAKRCPASWMRADED